MWVAIRMSSMWQRYLLRYQFGACLCCLRLSKVMTGLICHLPMTSYSNGGIKDLRNKPPWEITTDNPFKRKPLFEQLLLCNALSCGAKYFSQIQLNSSALICMGPLIGYLYDMSRQIAGDAYLVILVVSNYSRMVPFINLRFEQNFVGHVKQSRLGVGCVQYKSIIPLPNMTTYY